MLTPTKREEIHLLPSSIPLLPSTLRLAPPSAAVIISFNATMPASSNAYRLSGSVSLNICAPSLNLGLVTVIVTSLRKSRAGANSQVLQIPRRTDMESLSSAEEEALIGNFCGITSSTAEEARFFLESHQWTLDSAIHSYYDSADEHRGGGEDDEEDYQAAATAVPQDPLPPAAPRTTRSVTASMSSRDKGPAAAAPSGSRPKIRTLADLSHDSDHNSDSDSEEPQEYYTGGEKSGMLVQDPTKGHRDVDSIFNQARQMGAMQGPFEHRPTSRSFTGTGRLLSGETVPAAPQPPEGVFYNICFWSNGFTVDDGPLRRLDDPANAQFLECIEKSVCPRELEPADPRSEVHINLVRKDENYKEPVKRAGPFRGVGRVLGSSTSSRDASFEPSAGGSHRSPAPSPSRGLSVDGSLPSTSIQLRLADGTRMIARFNTHHTVGDIRAFIDASRPGAARTYQLQTVGFPPKQLSDANMTIEQAGLANSVVIQRA